MNSFEIRAEANTTPSESEHEFLMEALDAIYHRNITTIQIACAEKLQELEMFLEGADNPYSRKVTIDQMIQVRDERTRIKNRMAQERDVRIEQLTRWELDRGRQRG